MTVPVATVIGGRLWEPELVETARHTGLARVVARCARPDEVVAASPPARIVVVGTETPWLTGAVVRSWRRHGLAVVGLVPPEDRPGRRLLEDGGCDLVVDDHIPPVRLLGRLLALDPPRPDPPGGRLVTVTGPRGAPGRSEVALALAWLLGLRAPTLLAETDDQARSMGLRLGLAPVGQGAGLRVEAVGPIEVLHLSPGGGPLASSLLTRTLAFARERYRYVVVDPGPMVSATTGTTVVVTTPEPITLVRTASLLDGWDGPAPLVVANRARGEGDVRRVRRATGLEPAACVPPVASPPPGSPPPRPVVAALEPLTALGFSRAGGPTGTSPGIAGPSASPGAARTPTPRPRGRAGG